MSNTHPSVLVRSEWEAQSQRLDPSGSVSLRRDNAFRDLFWPQTFFHVVTACLERGQSYRTDDLSHSEGLSLEAFMP